MLISTLFGNTIKQASKTKIITNGSPEREKGENRPKVNVLTRHLFILLLLLAVIIGKFS
jgi:hypothetical protein